MPTDEYFGIGTNNLKSRDSFYSRAAYSVYAFEGKEEYSNVKNFWSMESIFYGKVDTFFMPVHINNNRLVSIPGEDNQYVLPFVRDAFLEMKKELQYGLLSGKITTSPFLRDVKVHKSAIPLDPAYRGWADAIIRRAVVYLSNSPKFNTITTFENFVPHMRNFLKAFAKNNIVTRSSYAVSSQTSLAHTGLCLELANDDASKDFEKVATYIDDPGYTYFLKVAQKYGFYVDKNMPWRLVANITSRPMQQFIEQTGTPSDLTSVLAVNYVKAYSDDLNALQYIFFNTYSHLVTTRPSFSHTFEKNGNLFSETLRRTALRNTAEMLEVYSLEQQLQLYVELKNEEKKWDFSQQQLDRVYENAIDIKNLLDISGAMRYINWVFRDYPAIEGSSSDRQLRKFYRSQTQFSFNNYQEFLSNSALIKNKR